MASSFRFGLAPMEGVTDLPFRLWMSMASDPAMTCTPFLRVTSTYPARFPLEFAPELHELRGQVRYQLLPQLMAAQAEDFVRVAKPLLQHSSVVELNCGCPAPNAVGSGAGSSLLKAPDQFRQFLLTSLEQVGASNLAVKMRLGFEDSGEFDGLLSRLKDLPLKQLTIHGRTRKDRYSAYARWDLIRAAGEYLDFPVIGSGDILGWRSVQERQDQLHSVHDILIGRGALRNPWIFILLRQQKEELRLPSSVLPDSLTVYALLVELYRKRFPDLMNFVASGAFLTPCLDVAERWTEIRDQLMILNFGHMDRHHLENLDRGILGRVKLIWNYLRSSLPDAFFAPKILRMNHIGEFFAAISQLCDESSDIVVSHRAEYDWIYTSDKKPPGDYPSFAGKFTPAFQQRSQQPLYSDQWA
ncbi:MAG: tRNA-dihydrouridine synthase family protein [Oligoflexus sp.]